MKRVRRFGFLIAAVWLCGCAADPRIRIETNRPARVLDHGGHVICERTPCTYQVSRETCGGFDSSSGYLILQAEADDGARASSAAYETCNIKDGERVLIELPAPK